MTTDMGNRQFALRAGFLLVMAAAGCCGRGVKPHGNWYPTGYDAGYPGEWYECQSNGRTGGYTNGYADPQGAGDSRWSIDRAPLRSESHAPAPSSRAPYEPVPAYDSEGFEQYRPTPSKRRSGLAPDLAPESQGQGTTNPADDEPDQDLELLPESARHQPHRRSLRTRLATMFRRQSVPQPVAAVSQSSQPRREFPELLTLASDQPAPQEDPVATRIRRDAQTRLIRMAGPADRIESEEPPPKRLPPLGSATTSAKPSTQRSRSTPRKLAAPLARPITRRMVDNELPDRDEKDEETSPLPPWPHAPGIGSTKSEIPARQPTHDNQPDQSDLAPFNDSPQLLIPPAP